MVLVEYINNLYSIILNIWLHVLLGVVLAFLIQYLVPKKKVLKAFGRNGFKTIILSSLIGVVLSACSYGAVPVIAGLKKKGATTASCLTMLLSTPWMGLFQSVVLTAYIGAFNSLIMLIISVIVSLAAGFIFSILEDYKLLDKPKNITPSMLKSCDCGEGIDYFNGKASVKEFMDLTVYVGKNLLIGLLFTALIKTVVSPAQIVSHLGVSNLSVIYAVPLATLIETIGEGLGVFAGELFLLGANLGVVFAIMMTGVTTDITELTMLNTIIGKRTATYYIIISTIIVVITSYIINIVL